MKTVTEFYETPETRIQELLPEGILCSSLADTSIDDFTYEEFEW